MDTSDEELIKIGLRYLSDNILYRDLDTDLRGRPTAHSPAVEYSNAEMRVIRRVLDFIETSDENLQWLHDTLMEEKYVPAIWEIFFKIWSKEYNKRHPKEISETINIGPKGDWVKRAEMIIKEKEVKND